MAPAAAGVTVTAGVAGGRGTVMVTAVAGVGTASATATDPGAALEQQHTLTELGSGIQVVTEPLPSVRSVALGLWVRVGSRDEQPAEAGISHFLEHMLFKG